MLFLNGEIAGPLFAYLLLMPMWFPDRDLLTNTFLTTLPFGLFVAFIVLILILYGILCVTEIQNMQWSHLVSCLTFNGSQFPSLVKAEMRWIWFFEKYKIIQMFLKKKGLCKTFFHDHH